MIVINESILLCVACILMAFCGAVNRYLYIAAKEKQQPRMLVSGIFNSFFVGFMVYLLCKTFNVKWGYALVISGMFGHGGPDGLEWVRKLLMFIADGIAVYRFNKDKYVIPDEPEADDEREDKDNG